MTLQIQDGTHEIAFSGMVRMRTTLARPSSIPILLLLGLVILIGALQPSFLTVDTLLVVMADTATLFILAAGITFVVMLGGIDLSIQAVASLSSVIVAVTLSRVGYWAFPATLAGRICHRRI